MGILLELIDKTGRKIHLSEERYKHIQKHPYMHDSLETIKRAIQNPTTLRYNEEDDTIRFFYKEFKENNSFEKYLFVSVKYLNGEGFIITSFYTNKITGSKWKI
jgi:hypothetical protein